MDTNKSDNTKLLLMVAIISELLLVLVILCMIATKSGTDSLKIEATLLSQGVGANSIRCALNKDAASCALATHETMASPVTPNSSTDPQPEVTAP